MQLAEFMAEVEKRYDRLAWKAESAKPQHLMLGVEREELAVLEALLGAYVQGVSLIPPLQRYVAWSARTLERTREAAVRARQFADAIKTG